MNRREIVVGAIVLVGLFGERRASGVSLEQPTPIADGSTLFTCQATIAPSAPMGAINLSISDQGASYPQGNAFLPVGGTDGAISVTPDSAPVCGDGVVEMIEDCDDGGTCLGGMDAGKHCVVESDCRGDGACLSGSKVSTPCSTDSDCPGGTCRHCVPQGGDGCAANCTSEIEIPFTLEPGEVDQVTQSIKPGTSGATVYGNLQIPLPLTGQQTFTVGRERNGIIPVTVKATSVQFPKIDVQGLACACVRGVPAKTCGGTAFAKAGGSAQDCTPGFATDTMQDGPCPADLPCAFVHGAGNSASGVVSCAAGLQGVDINVTQDDANAATSCTADAQCATLPGDSTCINDPDNTGHKFCSAAPSLLTLTGTGAAGSAILINSTAIGQRIGACVSAPTFCTSVDPFSDPKADRGAIGTIPISTGTATGEFTTADGISDNTVCQCKDPDFLTCSLSQCAGPWTVRGVPISCSELAIGNAAGGALVSSLTAPHIPIVGDSVITNVFVGPGPLNTLMPTPTRTNTGSPTQTRAPTATSTITRTPITTFTPTEIATFTPTETPTLANTPGAKDCCQCNEGISFCGPPTAGRCGTCLVVIGASCDGLSGSCILSTPTRTPTITATPGMADCCQCAGSASVCGPPADGSCGPCVPVFGASCDGVRGLCVLFTPTPTITRTPTASATHSPSVTPSASRTLTATTTPTGTATVTPTLSPSQTETETPTPTTVPTSTETPTASVTTTPRPCGGDCNGSGAVKHDDLLTMVEIALGKAEVASCTPGHLMAGAEIRVDEILRALNNAIAGCPAVPTGTPTVTPTPLPATATRTVTPSTTPTPMSALSGFEPMSGPPDTVVTLRGRNLDTVTAVAFNGAAASFTIVSPSEAHASVPQGATSGPVSVTTPDGTLTTATVFAVITPSTFTLTLEPDTASVLQGQSTAYVVKLDSGDGFSQLANLQISGLPAGVTATLTPPQITARQTAILRATAGAGQPTGDVQFIVSASANVSGVPAMQSARATLSVQSVTTSFLGRTVEDDTMETPVAGVTITFLGKDSSGQPTGCTGQQTLSDAAGNFAFTNLPDVCTGEQLVRYDGATATSPLGQHAGVDLVYTIVAHQVLVAPVLIHLPRIEGKETVMVQQNAPFDQTFTFKTIPFLSVTVYAGTVLTLKDGTRPDPFPLTAMQVPVDRLPEENSPAAQNPSTFLVFIVAFQPANAVASQPVAVRFPNSLNAPPATRVMLMTLDPTRGQMVPYGTGTVSNDGTQVIPDADPARPGHRYGLVHFDWHGPTTPSPSQTNPSPDPEGPKTCSPIDLSSGLEVLTSTDIEIGGLLAPVSISRTYRTLSNNPGPFGIGTNHNYGYQLNLQQGPGLISLVTPDGNQFPLNFQSDGSFTNSTIPSLRGAAIRKVSSGAYDLRWKDGTVFGFQTLGLATVLTSIKDPNRNQISLVPGALATQLARVIDPVGRALTLTYDGSNRITSIVDPIGRTVRYTYNAQGTLATVTDPEGGVTTYEYDARNRLTQITDPRDVVTTQNTYDQNGRVIQQVQADGGIIKFDYTLLNPAAPAVSPVLLTRVTDPLGNQTVYHFNPQGFLLDVTDASGQTQIFERDAGTNLVLAVHGVASCSLCGSQGAGDQTFTYDANGNVLSRMDALGKTTTYAYDPTFNKVSSVTDALGHVTELSYDDAGNLLKVTEPGGQMTSFAYDWSGLLTSVTDALGNIRMLTYDGMGNLVRVIDPLGNRSRLDYDAISRLISTTDPRGKTTYFSYDRLNRTTAVVDAMNGITTFVYDPNGNLLHVTDALNHTTDYKYDDKNHLMGRTDPLGAFESFQYDLDDNLIRHTDRKGQLSTFTYDTQNRRTSASYADGAIVGFGYDARGRLVRATDSAEGQILRMYDLLDRLIQESGSTGAIDYTYDRIGQRVSMSVVGQVPVTYAYDLNSRLTQIVQGGQVVDFGYDALGRRTQLRLPNGVTTDYGYDAASRITELLYRNTTGVLGNLTYQYDAASNRARVGGSFARTLLPEPITATTYNEANRQLQFGAKSMTFDDNGNLKTSTDASGVTTFGWDGRNRLTSIAGPSATAAFTYDIFGRRTGKQVNGRVTNYLYDGVDSVQELAGVAPVVLLRGLRIDELLLRNGSEHYLTDALGSTIALTDSTGLAQVAYTYEPFGRTEASGVTGNAFQYMGRENDGAGLYYFRARYYDAQSGRFAQEDPLGLAAGINRFAFVRNRPGVRRDPLGLLDVAGFRRGLGLLAAAVTTFFLVASGVGPVAATILITTGVVQTGLGAALTTASLVAGPGTLRGVPTSFAQTAAIVATASSSDEASLAAHRTAMAVDLTLAAAGPVLAGQITAAESLAYGIEAADTVDEVLRNRRQRTQFSPTRVDLMSEGTLTSCEL